MEDGSAMGGHGGDDHGHAPGDPPASHSMLVMGTGTVFLSHLPMFMVPHDYQVISQATFTDPQLDAQKVYVDDRTGHPGQRIYTIEPEAFVLPDLFTPPPPGPPKRTSFRANLYRGHFEQMAAKDKAANRLLSGAVVTIDHVVMGRRFTPAAPAPDHLTYLLFGKGAPLFLGHVISQPPDFDQFLSTTVSGHAFADADLARGVRVTVPKRTNSGDDRLTEGGAAVAASADVAGTPVPIQISPQVELYFNDNDDLR